MPIRRCFGVRYDDAAICDVLVSMFLLSDFGDTQFSRDGSDMIVMPRQHTFRLEG